MPESVKAQDGDTGINQPVVYSIVTGISHTSSFFCLVSNISFHIRFDSIQGWDVANYSSLAHTTTYAALVHDYQMHALIKSFS